MPIAITCTCGKSMRAKDDLAGRKVRCPQCGAAVKIPAGATPAAAPAPSAPVATAKAPSPAATSKASASAAKVAATTGSATPPKRATTATRTRPPAAAAPKSDANGYDFSDDAVPARRPAARPAAAAAAVAPLAAPRMPAPPALAATPVVAPPPMPVPPTVMAQAIAPATVYGVPVSRRGASAQDARRGAGLFHISGLSLTLIIAVIVIPTSIYLIKVGPVAANREWDRAYHVGIEDSQSVIARALHAHVTNEMGRPIIKSRDMPRVQNFRWVDEPQIMWRMPDWVEFRGRCSGGEYAGRYYTRTGEVQAVIDYSGTPLNVTGRVKGASVECEIGGKTAEPLAAKPGDLIEDDPF